MGTMGMPYGLQSMLKEGHKHFSGISEATLKNIEACKGLSQITRTSMGPNGAWLWTGSVVGPSSLAAGKARARASKTGETSASLLPSLPSLMEKPNTSFPQTPPPPSFRPPPRPKTQA